MKSKIHGLERFSEKRRNALFRGGRPLPDLTGKRVILVDDGLASGFTMLASVDIAKKTQTRKLFVAVPKLFTARVEFVLSLVESARHRVIALNKSFFNMAPGTCGTVLQTAVPLAELVALFPKPL